MSALPGDIIRRLAILWEDSRAFFRVKNVVNNRTSSSMLGFHSPKDSGSDSTRSEFDHVKAFNSSTALAVK
jgi:hypothetical protein